MGLVIVYRVRRYDKAAKTIDLEVECVHYAHRCYAEKHAVEWTNAIKKNDGGEWIVLDAIDGDADAPANPASPIAEPPAKSIRGRCLLGRAWRDANGIILHGFEMSAFAEGWGSLHAGLKA